MSREIDICMVVDNDVRYDARVRKEAASLAAAGWRVVVVGISTADPAPPDDEMVNGFRILLVRPGLLRRRMPGKYGKAIRRFIGFVQAGMRLRGLNTRSYHAHDFTGLLCLVLGGLWRRRFVYDSHELFFDRTLNHSRAVTPTRFVYGRLRFIERFMARRASAVITDCEPIAEVLASRFAIPRPLALMNAVDLRTMQEAVPLPRQPGQRIVTHTGGLMIGRHLPQLVASLQLLPEDVSLALIGGGSLQASLESHAKSLGVQHRVLFIPPVPVFAVSPTLAQADCAAVLITSGALHYHLTLPNKFFEAVAAGLPLVYAPTQEVSRLAREHDLGVSCDPTDPRSIAEAIETVLEPEASARYRANVARARETLNWEHQEQKLVDLYRQILG